jgi:hypothetical protein
MDLYECLLGVLRRCIPKEIQIFAWSKEIGQNEDLNTFGEKNSSGIQRTRRGINGGALGDPFPPKIHPLPWLNLQICIGGVYGGFEKGERGAWDEGGGVKPGEMIDARENGG